MSPPPLLWDRTLEAWGQIQTIPDGTRVPNYPSAQCLRDTKTCISVTVRNKPGLPAPSHFPTLKGWNPENLDEWVFTADPLIIGPANNRVLDITRAPAPAGYQVRILGTRLGPDEWPKSIAVAIPHGLPEDQPVSFLVWYQNIPAQAKGTTVFHNFHPPLGWDWLYYQYWNVLNFNSIPICRSWTAFGLPYQLTFAKKKFVLVLPQIPFETQANDPRINKLLSGATVGRILAELQQMLAPKLEGTPPPKHVAMAGFSNGNLILEHFFRRLLKSTDHADRAMLATIKEAYAFAPPEATWAGDQVLQTLQSWRAATSDGVIRAYTHSHYSSGHTHLLGAKNAKLVQPDKPIEISDHSGRATLAYLPYQSTDNIWKRTFRTVQTLLHPVRCTARTFDFANVHHWIPALMLTDAARRSPFL